MWNGIWTPPLPHYFYWNTLFILRIEHHTLSPNFTSYQVKILSVHCEMKYCMKYQRLKLAHFVMLGLNVALLLQTVRTMCGIISSFFSSMFEIWLYDLTTPPLLQASTKHLFSSTESKSPLFWIFCYFIFPTLFKAWARRSECDRHIYRSEWQPRTKRHLPFSGTISISLTMSNKVWFPFSASW